MRGSLWRLGETDGGKLFYVEEGGNGGKVGKTCPPKATILLVFSTNVIGTIG